MADYMTNQLKLCMYTNNPGTKALQSLMDVFLKKQNKSLEDFLNEHQHEIYHLFTSKECCQCVHHRPKQQKSVVSDDQMRQLYIWTNVDRLQGHNTRNNASLCCCKANQTSTDDLDVSLMKVLLKNFFISEIWETCLSSDNYNNSFKQFLDSHSHEIFHLLKSKDTITCCVCIQNRCRPLRRERCSITEKDFNNLFMKTQNHCSLGDKCSLSYKSKEVTILDVKNNTSCPNLYVTLMRTVNQLYISINDIAYVRNQHSHKNKFSDEEYKDLLERLQVSIRRIETYLNINILDDKLERFFEQINLSADEIEKIRLQYINNNNILANGIGFILKGLFDLSKIFSSQKKLKNNKSKKIEKTTKVSYPRDFKRALKRLYCKETVSPKGVAVKKLFENCIHLGYTLDEPTPKNGNCFFEAISHQLPDSPDNSAQQLRQRVVHFLVENKEFEGPAGPVNLEFFLDENYNGIEDWANKMKQDGTFIDNIVVTGMAKMLEKKICVVTSSSESSPENCLICFDFGQPNDGNHILLGHVFENHYESLISLQDVMSKLKISDEEENEKVISDMDMEYCVEKGMLSRNHLVTDDCHGDQDFDLSENNEITLDGESSDEDDIPDTYTCGVCKDDFPSFIALCQHKDISHKKGKKRKMIEDNEETKTKVPRLVAEMTLTFKSSTHSWETICKKNIDAHIEEFDSKSMKILLSENGSLVIWTSIDHSAAKKRKTLVKSTDMFMKNLFEKCPVKEETSISVKLKIREVSEDDDDEKDIFKCGRCEVEYTELREFYMHRRECKRTIKAKRTCHKNDTDKDDAEKNYTSTSHGMVKECIAKNPDISECIEIDTQCQQGLLQEQLIHVKQEGKQSDDDLCSTSGYDTGTGHETDMETRSRSIVQGHMCGTSISDCQEIDKEHQTHSLQQQRIQEYKEADKDVYSTSGYETGPGTGTETDKDGGFRSPKQVSSFSFPTESRTVPVSDKENSSRHEYGNQESDTELDVSREYVSDDQLPYSTDESTVERKYPAVKRKKRPNKKERRKQKTAKVTEANCLEGNLELTFEWNDEEYYEPYNDPKDFELSDDEFSDDTSSVHSLITQNERNGDHADWEIVKKTVNYDQESESEYKKKRSKLLPEASMIQVGLTLSEKCLNEMRSKFKKRNKKYERFYCNLNQAKAELNRLCEVDQFHRVGRLQIRSSHEAVCTLYQPFDGTEEVTISGRSKCGKAYTDDEVVVHIFVPEKTTRIERLDKNIKTELYGEIVGILKRSRYENVKHPVFVCELDKYEYDKAKPICKTLPKFHLYSEQRTENGPFMIDIYNYDENRKTITHKTTMSVNPSIRSNFLFYVAFICWDNLYPLGVIVKVHDATESLLSALDILELQCKVPTLYSKETVETNNRMQNDMERMYFNEKEKRKDFTKMEEVEIFTIDPVDSRVLDDAIHIREYSKDWFEVGVHITDFICYMKQCSDLDVEARCRGTTFFRGGMGSPHQMLPERLSTERFSLKSNESRLALTVLFFFDRKLECVNDMNAMFTNAICLKSVVRSKKSFAYSEVQNIIDRKRKSEYGMLQLFAICKRLREKRIGLGIFSTPFEYDYSDEGNPTKFPEAYYLIEELMVLTNHFVATYLLHRFPTCVPLRCHDPPDEDKLRQWRKSYPKVADLVLRLQGYPKQFDCERRIDIRKYEELKLRCNDIICIQRWVWESAFNQEHKEKLLGMEELHPFQCLAIKDWQDIQKNAEYRCSGSVSGTNGKHFGLGIFPYLHFTAPLRRYIDIVVHRLLHAAIEGNTTPPYDQNEIVDICKEINLAAIRAKEYQKRCRSLLFAQTLQKSPITLHSIVNDCSEKQVELVFPGFDFIKKHCRNIKSKMLGVIDRPKLLVDSDKFNSVSNRKFVVLRWKSRIYSRTCRLPYPKNPREGYGCHENTKKKSSTRAQRIDPNQKIDFQQMIMWIEKLNNHLFESNGLKFIASKQNDLEPGEKLSKSFLKSSLNTENDVNSEVIHRTRKYHNADKLMITKQFCDYSLDFHRAQVVAIQLHSEIQKGILTPYIQLVHITNSIQICFQHMQDPVGCLEKYATKSSRDSYSDSKHYKDVWLPIISMEMAMSSVRDSSIRINDVPVTFKKNSEGYFVLSSAFLRERNIDFNPIFEFVTDEHKDPTIQSSDYLCIKCPVSTKDNKPFSVRRSTSPEEYKILICHAKILRVKKANKGMEDEKTRVHFSVLDTKQIVSPDRYFGSIQLIQKQDSDKRMEIAIQRLNRSSELLKCIALNRRIPDLSDDTYARTCATWKKTDLDIGLPQNNEQQMLAIQHALKSNFTLIHGPPGTGKTNVGIKLVCLFSEINKKIEEEGGERKQLIYCGPSNKSVDLVAARLLDLKRKDGPMPSIVRLYGSSIENADYSLPGRVCASPGRVKDSKSDESLQRISVHHLIRQVGKPHASEINKLYTELTETVVQITREEEVLSFDPKIKKSVRKTEEKSEPAQYVDPELLKEYTELIHAAAIDEIKKHDVVFCTTAMATNQRVLSALKGNIHQLIVDECGMCTEPESISTIIATDAKQVVLIGDHKQLQPVVVCPQARELGLQKSLFERYKSDSNVRLLTTQYRMHPTICEFPSKRFYSENLHTDPNSQSYVERQKLNLWPNSSRKTVFCHVYGEEEILPVRTEEGNEMSRRNAAEVDQVVKIFKYLHNYQKIHKMSLTINIMSQYNDQCAAIRSKLEKERLINVKGLTVNTVVSSQGGEWDYVIFSMVRSLPDYRIEKYPTLGWCAKNLGFITDEHQINVALTRARKGLFVIGNKHLLQCDHVWKDLIQTYGRYGCVVDGKHFPQPFISHVPAVKERRKKPHSVDDEGFVLVT